MEFEIKLKEVQKSLAEQDIEGWLLYDFRHSNPLACTFLDIPADQMLTRRFFYWIPQKGDPIKIVSLIEPYTLDHLPGVKWSYRGWQELERLLFSLAVDNTKIAMEYSPYNALPVVAKVDAGTIELIRKTGAEVVSSADLLQRYTSVWTEDQVQSHLAAAHVLEDVVSRTWAFIEHKLHNKIPLNEYQVQQFMWQAIHDANCQSADAPTCAVNAHSADPHYHPQPNCALPIRAGDFILLDLWCKQNTPRSVYADITRVGVAGQQPTQKQHEIFKIVQKARDRATLFIKEHYETQCLVQGW